MQKIEPANIYRRINSGNTITFTVFDCQFEEANHCFSVNSRKFNGHDTGFYFQKAKPRSE